ncbi:MAG: aminotransferase class I/II-fold pyridoxal phosphate-dependent enzyme, partial [Pygmaiobacter sp.]
MEKLAIMGGTPVRDTQIYYGRQWIDEDDIKAVENVLRDRLITCGPRVEGLEKKLCQVTGAQYAVAMSSGTAALHTACMALGIGPGDEVITTPMTFAASANCARYCGASVVFADINPDTYNIDPIEIEKKITPRTKAIIAVHFTGQSVEHDAIRALCDKYGIYLIEDAAHAIGTKYKGQPIGSIADITCFSFHPVKTVTSGEGGAAT